MSFLGLGEVREHFFRAGFRNNLAQLLDSRALNIRDAAEFAQQALRRARPHSGNFQQRRRSLPLAAALAVEGNREAMRFVANLLDQMQNWRMPLQDRKSTRLNSS